MKSTEIAQNALNKVVELFRAGKLPELMSETLARNPNDPRPMAGWSVSNQLITAFSGTKDARGYRQWQSVGRYVKAKKDWPAGMDTVYILAPILFPVETEVVKADGTKENAKRMVLGGFRGLPVFPVECTAGAPLELPDLKLAELKYREVAEKLGLKVDAAFWGQHKGAYGWYCGGTKEITLASPEQTVWFHELAHAIDHHLRGNEFNLDPKEETEAVAEMAAATLAYLNGYRIEEMSFAKQYIELFLGKSRWETKLLGLMNRIGAVVSFAISGGEKQTEEQVITQ